MEPTDHSPAAAHPPRPVWFRWPFWATILLGAFLFFTRIGHRHLWAPDEGRYAEIAREMLETGDWVTPQLDYVLYFEKPPLQYWASALSMAVGGVTEEAVRFPVAVFGLIGLICVFFLASELADERTGFLAAIVLATNPFYFALSRFLVLDMALTAMTTLAIVSYALSRLRSSRSLTALSGAALALGVLAKGPIAVVLFCFAVFPWILFDSKARPDLKDFLIFVAVCLTVSVPWFVLVARVNPTFLHFFFVHEHLDRFLTKSHFRTGPPWYFVPVVLLGFFPWIYHLRPTGSPRRILWLLGAWTVLPFAFFSVSQSKLPPYVLPIFPALAVLIALGMAEAGRTGRWKSHAITSILAGACAILLGTWVSNISPGSQDPVIVATRPWFGWSIILYGALLAGAGFWFLFRPGPRLVYAQAFVCTLGLAGIEIMAKNYEPRRNCKFLVDVIQARRQPGEKVYLYGPLENANPLPFYLQERVRICAFNFAELEMGQKLDRPQDREFLLDGPAAEPLLQPTAPRSWWVIDNTTFNYFKEHPGLKVQEVVRYGKLVLFTNR